MHPNLFRLLVLFGCSRADFVLHRRVKNRQ